MKKRKISKKKNPSIKNDLVEIFKGYRETIIDKLRQIKKFDHYSEDDLRRLNRTLLSLSEFLYD